MGALLLVAMLVAAERERLSRTPVQVPIIASARLLLFSAALTRLAEPGSTPAAIAAIHPGGHVIGHEHSAFSCAGATLLSPGAEPFVVVDRPGQQLYHDGPCSEATPRSHHGGEDNMKTSRISAVAIALSIGFGFVGGAGSSQRPAKDQNLSATNASSKRMADGKVWTTANLNVNTSSSYCYDDAEPNCRRYGRLYTWESAQRGCQSLGDGWRLPTDDEWRQLANHYGGLGNDSPEKGRKAYTALLSGGTSGFDAVLGGNRSIDGQYDRLEAHGIYWTVSENDPLTAPFYNFGKGSQALYRGPQGQKRMAVSVRCVRE